MSEYLNIIKESLTLSEKSLSRLLSHMENHDCGTITAYRSARDCNEGEPYTKKENQQRNKKLLAMLSSKRYGITSVKGSYIEDFGTSKAKEVGEHVFFVVDLNDSGNLESDLRKFGEEFEQDSILFIAKGGESATLIGTNQCKNGYPGYGKKIKFNTRGMGKSGEFFTKVGNMPFTFSEGLFEEHKLPHGYFGRWSCSAIANSRWEDIDI
jgi:hypothetical protein